MIAGKKYQLSGFEVRKADNAGLAGVFAVFAEKGTDVENPPQAPIWAVYKDMREDAEPCKTRRMTPEELMSIVVDFDAFLASETRFAVHMRDVALDLGRDKLTHVLSDMAMIDAGRLQDGHKSYIPANGASVKATRIPC